MSPPCSAVVEGDRKLLYFYDWPNDLFFYDLKADLGEQSNIATGNPEASRSLHQKMMDHLMEAGAHFPKQNPNADPKIKKYDPANPVDQGSFGPDDHE